MSPDALSDLRAAELSRRIADSEAALEHVPTIGDENAIKQWAEAAANLGSALVQLGRFDQAIERTTELEAILVTLDPLALSWTSVRTYRVIALGAAGRFQECVALGDELTTRYEAECAAAKIPPYRQTQYEWDQFASAERDWSTLSKEDLELALVRARVQNQTDHVNSMLRMKVLALSELGRLDEAYALATQVLELASVGARGAGSLENAQRLRAQVAYRQRRYARALIELFVLSGRRARNEYKRRIAESSPES